MLSLITLIAGLAAGLSHASAIPGNGDQINFKGDPKFTGEVTYFDPALGACGVQNGGGDFIAAIPISVWETGKVGTNPNNNSLCNRKVLITSAGGVHKNVVVSVTDRCVGCGPGDIDVTPAVFAQLADPSRGRVPVTWEFI